MFEAIERWSADGQLGLLLEPDALADMLDACRQSGPVETGGILVGKYAENSHLAVISAISRPGSDVRCGENWFVREVNGLSEWLAKLWALRSGHYVGEWHYHPSAEPTPSQRDIRQMLSIAKSDRYECHEPVLLIIGGDPERRWSLHAEVITRSGQRQVLNGRRRSSSVARPADE